MNHESNLARWKSGWAAAPDAERSKAARYRSRFSAERVFKSFQHLYTVVTTPAPNRERQRAVYLITFVCYGSWLHGREGSVDREHNMVGSPTLAEDPRRVVFEKKLMTQDSYSLDQHRRAVTLKGIEEACSRRGWMLLAAHVRSSHVHVVVDADRNPEKVMIALKAYASRARNDSECDEPGRRRWARHGSTRYLWTPTEITSAVRYVVDHQGEAMAMFMPASS